MLMSLKEIKNTILRIAKIKDPVKCQQELIIFAKEIRRPRIETRIRGHYAYFYVMEVYYDPEVKRSRERRIENLGRIKKESYQEDPDKFKKMLKSELKKYLEQY
jgi:hypothetical protein